MGVVLEENIGGFTKTQKPGKNVKTVLQVEIILQHTALRYFSFWRYSFLFVVTVDKVSLSTSFRIKFNSSLMKRANYTFGYNYAANFDSNLYMGNNLMYKEGTKFQTSGFSSPKMKRKCCSHARCGEYWRYWGCAKCPSLKSLICIRKNIEFRPKRMANKMFGQKLM